MEYSRVFDYSLLRWELDHFREWLLIADRCCRLSSNENIELEKVFNLISYELSSLPRVWVHRDFQSRNIMIKNVTSDSHSIHVIDFQDALMGPPIYDLVALLRDSYVDLGLELVNRLGGVPNFWTERGEAIGITG